MAKYRIIEESDGTFTPQWRPPLRLRWRPFWSLDRSDRLNLAKESQAVSHVSLDTALQHIHFDIERIAYLDTLRAR